MSLEITSKRFLSLKEFVQESVKEEAAWEKFNIVFS